jgi:molecular chaperone DnaK
MNPTVIGIDLGTTNSTVAVVREGILEIIPVRGERTMPSAVGIDPAGKLVIGRAAKNQAISAPENTVLSVKRLMGTDGTVELGGKSYRPEEISALILGELKRAAEEHLGHPISQAVITVPAFFNERQRLATQDAGKLAGLEVLRIINEPTAAALAYGAGQTDATVGQTLLVYDLGGGTFDVSVVRVEEGIVEVRASHGDVNLGGDDFDEALARLGEERFDSASPLPPAAHRRLKSAMELAKITLSDAPFASVREEYLTEGGHLETEIERADYEELIAPWLHKTLDCLQKSLSDADVTARELDKVMLVGGATRTPAVHALLQEKLGIEPRHEIDPDLVVAMGAAIQGAALAGQPAPAILVDISAHTYSVTADTGGGMFGPELISVPLIRRGTALPVTKSDVFSTVMDGQEKVLVVVNQGESMDPDENLKLGEFWVEGLSKAPAGNLIIVRFQIDLSGLLTVTATEKSTGLAKSVAIDTAGQHRINLDTARDNLAALFEETDSRNPSLTVFDPDEFDENEAIDVLTTESSANLLASAKSLRTRAEKLLERGVAETDAATIRTKLDGIPILIESRDWESLQDDLDSLSDLLFYLED